MAPDVSFTGKLDAVSGSGSGTGRELVRQLAAEGCSVTTCDSHPGHRREDTGAVSHEQ
jgi:NAD(P)-dependent dehydrogenase (short-subunit alcohol dehydrogenase family)